MTKPDLRSQSLEALEQITADLGAPRYRADQLFVWLHQKKATELSQMSNLPVVLLQQLEQAYELPVMKLKTKQVSAVDGTVKYLFQLEDGNCIETVQMTYHYGTSLCISTQVGCRMGCKFCASTLGGLVRNLTVGEMLSQVYESERISGETVDRLVLMGIGEPLDNLENVLGFLKILAHPKGKNLGLRHVALSTCGLVEGIQQLAKERLPITLAISLHGATDRQRSQIMPVNNKWKIAQVLEAAKAYFAVTGRRVTYEYGLMNGVNDSEKDAAQLAALLAGQNCHVNLIPINPVEGEPFSQSGRKRGEEFCGWLEQKGISATIRRGLGRDISAACGQLRHESAKVPSESKIPKG